MPERRRRERRRRSRASSGGQTNIFSRLGGLTPDFIENPVKTAIGGTFGFGGNLLGDVKDAVVGLPMGLVKMATDPIESVEAMAGSVWHTWSPLFKGDYQQFARQTYDHPLAPILDVATVFTLGAGTAARGAGALAKAGNTSTTVAKVAGLRTPKTRLLTDPTDAGRIDIAKPMSTRAGRRLVQETMVGLEPRLPQWYVKHRYERGYLVDMAHRANTRHFIQAEALKRGSEIEKAVAAGDQTYLSARLQAHAILEGGKALQDITELGRRARTAVVTHMHTNLRRHNRAYPKARAQNLLRSGHYSLIRDEAFMDTKHIAAIDKAGRAHANVARRWSNRSDKHAAEVSKWEAIRDRTAGEAARAERISAELEDVNRSLAAMYADGTLVTEPAKTARPPRRVIQEPNKRQAMTQSAQQIDRMERGIRQLEEQREIARNAAVLHEKAVTKLDNLNAVEKQWRDQIQAKYDEFEGLRNRATEDYLRYAGETYDRFEQVVNDFGRHATTRNFEHAAMDADGNYYIAPKHDAYNLAYEGGNSLKFIHKLIHHPTRIWKTAILGYTPRIVVNNGIGNWFLFAARELPSENGALAIYDAMRFSLPSKTAAAGEALFPKDHWLYRYFSDEIADSFGAGTMGVEGYQRQLSGVRGFLKRGFYPMTAAVSEKPLRAAALYKALRDMPEVKEAIRTAKAQGKSADYGIEQALRGANGQVLRDYAAQQSRRLGGDYITLNESEKFARDIIPFYLWNRHILKTTGNMLLDQPGRLAVGARLSDYGIEETEAMLGELPDFLKGALPLAALGLGDKPGRANIILTSSLNPFATVGELSESVNAFATGRGRRGAVFSQFNPFLTGALESATQTSLLTGKPSPREGGIWEDVFGRMIEGLPHVRIADALVSPDTETSPAGNDYMFKRDDLSPISSALGIGIRNLSLDSAGGGSGGGRRRRRRRRG